MARDPGSTWRPLPEQADGVFTKTQLIVHSTGTTASASNNQRYFAQANVLVESTFIIGLQQDDPTLQVMDSAAKADANTTASKRAISIEVVGTGDMAFTDWQVKELIRIGRWASTVHPIQRRLCPTHDQSGFGWHVMFGAPGPWTTVRGKVCPGAKRVQQLQQVIFPAIFTGATAPAPPTSEEDDMTPHQANQLTVATEHAAEARRLSGQAVDEVRGVAARIAALQAAFAAVSQVSSATGTVDLRAVQEAAERGAAAALNDLRIVSGT